LLPTIKPNNRNGYSNRDEKNGRFKKKTHEKKDSRIATVTAINEVSSDEGSSEESGKE
jgi:hypothetical protein